MGTDFEARARFWFPVGEFRRIKMTPVGFLTVEIDLNGHAASLGGFSGSGMFLPG